MTNNFYKRLLIPPQKTFFLLGPRGTGKSTWLLDCLPSPHRIDLLRSKEYLRFKADPSLLRKEILALPKQSWIIIDEIQKLPELLDEIHALIFDTKEQYHFALSGSSARKLKREQANLLAGRALSRKFFPLSCLEIGAGFELQKALSTGQLPHIWQMDSNEECIDFLDAYVETYLKEEIQQEAAVRGLNTFYKFLGVAALCNAQILNMSNIARDVGVARSTVQGYFEILNDTLLGWFLPSFRLKSKIKEISHPKFYFFDCGVVRTLRQENRKDLPPESLGHLFETFLLNEIRALNSYHTCGWELAYWRSQQGHEVDLILKTPTEIIGVEIKHTPSWKKKDNQGLEILLQEGHIQKAYGVYIGEKKLQFDSVLVLPYQDFLTTILS